jgi:integral membrane protein
MHLLKTEIGRLRIIAFIEGVSFLIILFITMPLKYGMDINGPNKVIGMLHGVLFVLYVLAVIQAKFTYNWNLKTVIWSLLASIIPFGTFWADKKYFVKY